MDDAPIIRSRHPAAAFAGLALTAILGAVLALAMAWVFSSRFLDRFEAALGDLLWLAIALAGAAAGTAIAGLLGIARIRDHETLAAPASGTLDDSSVWLHVVAGGRRDAVARAVCELVAHPLARGERVVVVDASRALRLHEPLGLSARLGFIECMAEGLPALGLLQSGGFTGLFLLARGRRGRITDWLPLDRVLEELQPHFDRVVLAFEPRIPAVIGGVLAGRMMKGWWAGPGEAAGRTAAQARGSLAIALSDMDLATMPKASLEALEFRLAGFAPLVPAPALPPAAAGSTAIEFRVSPPAVLDCDLQIRQKLRFLAWMRRMRTEGERTETAGRL